LQFTADASAYFLTSAEYAQLQELTRRSFGFDLREGKEQLLAARLGKLMRERQISTLSAYVRHVISDPTGEALSEMVDALTTNFTSFQREPAHFAFLQKVVVGELRSKAIIRGWSAACSTGEEPYSIGFAMQDMGALQRMELLATDISNTVLATARAGIYEKEKVTGIPTTKLRNYFLQGVGACVGSYRVKPEIRDRIRFGRLNLVEDFRQVGMFDFVFCRNVMIYWDKPTRERVVGNLARQLERGGYLFIGHAESLERPNRELDYVAPAIYRKR
jgi:chemotaxis protein methyltransferase CheR